MSRSFLVPVLLPADPTAALEAATKQYVDGRTPQPSAWTALTLQNAWVAAGSQPNQYRRIGDMVHVRGGIASGAAFTACFTLPTGHRPPAETELPALGYTGSSVIAGLRFRTDGQVWPITTGTIQFYIQFCVNA